MKKLSKATDFKKIKNQSIKSVEVAEGERQALEFAPEAYNYNTTDDEEPRNIILLCTTQGVAVQQDGEGAMKLFHHSNVDGTIERSWLEVESTSHKVGDAQVEIEKAKEDAQERGKATSAVIGTRAIGIRFNVLMAVQIPLQQKPREYKEDLFGGNAVYTSLRRGFLNSLRHIAASSAARVSKGSTLDDNSWTGLSVKDPVRHPSGHITATIVMYYTCSGGVSSEADVKAAIDDLEELYKAIEVNGKLADADFDFMKSNLTVTDMVDIQSKLDTQPPKPDIPLNANDFPS